MADVVHTRWIRELINGDADWKAGGASTYHCMVVDVGTWTPDADDVTVDQILNVHGAVELTDANYARQTLASVASAEDTVNNRIECDCAIIDFGTMAGAVTYRYFVIFQFVTDDTDSVPVVTIDVGAQSDSGQPLSLDPSSDGLFALPVA